MTYGTVRRATMRSAIAAGRDENTQVYGARKYAPIAGKKKMGKLPKKLEIKQECLHQVKGSKGTIKHIGNILYADDKRLLESIDKDLFAEIVKRYNAYIPQGQFIEQLGKGLKQINKDLFHYRDCGICKNRVNIIIREALAAYEEYKKGE